MCFIRAGSGALPLTGVNLTCCNVPGVIWRIVTRTRVKKYEAVTQRDVVTRGAGRSCSSYLCTGQTQRNHRPPSCSIHNIVTLSCPWSRPKHEQTEFMKRSLLAGGTTGWKKKYVLLFYFCNRLLEGFLRFKSVIILTADFILVIFSLSLCNMLLMFISLCVHTLSIIKVIWLIVTALTSNYHFHISFFSLPYNDLL